MHIHHTQIMIQIFRTFVKQLRKDVSFVAHGKDLHNYLKAS